MKVEYDKDLHPEVSQEEYEDGISPDNYEIKAEVEIPDAAPAVVVHDSWDGGASIDSKLNIKTFDFKEKYTPFSQSLEFFSWVNIVLGKQDNISPKTHYMIIDHMLKQGRRKEALCHRGFGKSEIISKFLPLYVAYKGSLPGFGKVENLVLFSATISQAEEHLMNMRIEYENNEELQKVLTLVDTKRIKPKNNQLVFDSVDGNRIYIQAKGAGESMRGTKKGKSRPQLLIFDDVMTDEILTSDVARKKLHSWFFSTVTGAVDISHYKYLVIGTPMTEGDLLGQMRVANNWETVEIPVAEEFPVPKENIVSSWPDRFTQEEIWDKYQEHKQMGAESEFYREYMLQVVSDDVRLFKKNMFRYYDYNELKDKFPGMLFFTSMDLAVSRKQSADYTAILTIGVDSSKNWFVVKANHGRWDPTKTLDILFEHVKMYAPLAVGVENAALQQVLDHFMNERMIRENTFFNIVKLKSNSAIKKEVRISGLHPRFSLGKVWFNKRETATKVELEHELSMMTREACLAQHDDVADCLANFTDEDFVFYPGDSMGSEIQGAVDELNFDDYKDSTIF